DGIRDFHVTGVKTCALPILPRGNEKPRRAGRPGRGAGRIGKNPRLRGPSQDPGEKGTAGRRRAIRRPPPLPHRQPRRSGGVLRRSEERREGNEGKSRGKLYE